MGEFETVEKTGPQQAAIEETQERLAEAEAKVAADQRAAEEIKRRLDELRTWKEVAPEEVASTDGKSIPPAVPGAANSEDEDNIIGTA